jgi:hypothetical protein
MELLSQLYNLLSTCTVKTYTLLTLVSLTKEKLARVINLVFSVLETHITIWIWLSDYCQINLDLGVT